jgi:hypothetical protein
MNLEVKAEDAPDGGPPISKDGAAAAPFLIVRWSGGLWRPRGCGIVFALILGTPVTVPAGAVEQLAPIKTVTGRGLAAEPRRKAWRELAEPASVVTRKFVLKPGESR